jgi:hypothetical protein
VESDVFELKGLDSLEVLLEHTDAGQGGLPGPGVGPTLTAGPASSLLLLSGFCAISEKYTCNTSSCLGTTTRNKESLDFWII